MLATICVVVVIIQILFYVLPWIYRNFFGPTFVGCKLDVSKYGEWAIVTGASDGIGKEFAKQMAKNGLNVVLISRTLKKLETLAADIQKEYKVQTKIVPVDFTAGLEVYDVISKSIEELDIGVLVNNVGMGIDRNSFHASEKQYMKDIIACNITTIPFMTQLVIKNMLKKKTGLIINISSLSSMIPTPICLYSATKGYVDKFTQDFALEYQHQGIDVQAYNPGLVKTNMWTLDGNKWFKPDAKRYVESAMNCLGYGLFTIGYIPHVLYCLGVKIVYFIFPRAYGFVSRKLFGRQ